MKTSERSITSGILAFLKTLPSCFATKLHGGPYQMAGLPDILCVLDGKAIFFEVKREGGRPTAIQERCHKRLLAAGAGVGVVSSVEDVQIVMEMITSHE